MPLVTLLEVELTTGTAPGRGLVAREGRCERTPLPRALPSIRSTISLPARLSYSSNPFATISSSRRCAVSSALHLQWR